MFGMFTSKSPFDKGWDAAKSGENLENAAVAFDAEPASSEFNRFVEGYRAFERNTKYVAPTVAEAIANVG